MTSYFFRYFVAGLMYILVHRRQYNPADIGLNQYQYSINKIIISKMNRPKKNQNDTQKEHQPKPIIRSKAFRKKFEDGMPRINHKAIPFHNFYDIEISNMEIALEHGLNFWGCVLPEKRKFRIKQTTSQQKREIQTRGETIFKKYMKRRPSLNLTPRSYDFTKEESPKNYETITDFRPEKYKEMKTNPELEPKAQNSANFMLTQDDLSTINKKSLYQMTPHELEVSIEWKKRFLQIFEKKMKQAKNFQYNFKPYKS